MMRINLLTAALPTYPLPHNLAHYDDLGDLAVRPEERNGRVEIDIMFQGERQGTAFQTFRTIEAVVSWARRYKLAVLVVLALFTACGAPTLTACEGPLPVTCTDVASCAVSDGGLSYSCEVEPCVPYCWRRDR